MKIIMSAVSGSMKRVSTRRSPIMEMAMTTVSMSLDRRVMMLPVPSSMTAGTGAPRVESSAEVRRSTERRRVVEVTR